MTYRRLFVLVVLLVAIFAPGCSSGASKDELLKVTEFMDPDDVELIMGKPNNVRYDKLGSAEVMDWDYTVAGGRWTISFGRGGHLLGGSGGFQTLQGTKGGQKDHPEWGKRSKMKPFSEF
jgi:hypothetical protein